MAKLGQLGVRLEPRERAALERAAAYDRRPLSAMLRKILVEWLVRHGWLEEER
jgi:hypothetical protein